VTDESDPVSHVPAGPVPTSVGGRHLLELVKVMARLRGPDGCPWDREQTHETLARHLLEESHELLEAIDAGDSDAIRDELGDLLLQVVFHAQMASDEGRWDVDDVARGLVEKLVHRHPHVFGDVEVEGAAEVLRNWDQIKRDEEGREDGVFADVPETLPGPLYARKLLRRAGSSGHDWPPDGAADKLRREVDRAIEAGDGFDAIGDLLLAAVALARERRVDPELALRAAADRMRAEVEGAEGGG
jgi:MazG family protein